jgi:hypothetical protein
MSKSNPKKARRRHPISECGCGDPPYTDGRKCPECLDILAEDLKERVESGELSPMAAFACLWVQAVHEEESDDSGEDSHTMGRVGHG